MKLRLLLVAAMMLLTVTVSNATLHQFTCFMDNTNVPIEEGGPSTSTYTGGGTFIYDDVAGTLSTSNFVYFATNVPDLFDFNFGGPGFYSTTVGTMPGPYSSPYSGSLSFPGSIAAVNSAIFAGNMHMFFWYNENSSLQVIRGQLIYQGVLPVELSSFSAVPGTNGVALSWRTETESNNARFILERKSGDEAFSVLTQLNTRSSNGNSSTPLAYSYLDRSALSGVSYTYRLSQQDLDGTVRELRTVTVMAGREPTQAAVVKGERLLGAYPNPFNPTTSISVDLQGLSKANIAVYNMNGELVKSFDVNGGSKMKVDFDGTGLASGSYLVRLTSGNAEFGRQMITLLK